MRSGEESDQTVGVGFPNAEGEFERFVIGAYVVVADQDGACGNGASGKETSVESGG